MKTALIRVDASLEIGSGHVMRCLTLAKALKSHGVEVLFICRDLPNHMIEIIAAHGFSVMKLSRPAKPFLSDSITLTHSAWLGVSQQQDAEECRALLGEQVFDWMIVDHYGLDTHWESLMQSHYRKLLVIDDLADRIHCADILLDQNLGRTQQTYAGKVPVDCQCLLGTEFALLRDEFAEWRATSLQYRTDAELRSVMLSFGGVDKDNYTLQALEQLQAYSVINELSLTVVVGSQSPHLQSVQAQAAKLPCPVQLLVNVDNMAELLSQTDLVIGACGSSAWERCCLGVPSVVFVLAVNQEPLANALAEVGAARRLERMAQLNPLLANSADWLADVGQRAAAQCDGLGTQRVLRFMGLD